MTETDALTTRHGPIHPYRYAGNSYSPTPNYISVPNVTHLVIHDLEVASVVRLLADGIAENLSGFARTAWRRSRRSGRASHVAAFSTISELTVPVDPQQILGGIIVSPEEHRTYSPPGDPVALSEASKFLNKLYMQDTKKAPKSIILEAIQTVFALIARGSFQTIDAVLYNAKVESLAPELIVTLLRSTTTSREKLPVWDDFFSRARVELNSRGFDTDVILQGL